jgi:predicted nucleic-acid-binding protein
MRNLTALIDTNILIDFLNERVPFNDAADQIFDACSNQRVSGYIAAHSVTDAFYILRKDYSAKTRKNMLLDLFDVLNVEGIDKAKLTESLLNEDFDDIEDRLQVECAKAVNADYIVTRNITDFAISPIKAILPEDFLKLLDQGGMEQ